MRLPKADEINWLEFGTHNRSFITYVKRGDQWYFIGHDEGFLTAGRKVTAALIEEESTKIPGWLSKNGGRSRGWTAEWSSEYKDRPDFFTAGDADERMSIAQVLDAIDDDFDKWLDSKYPENS